MSTALFPTITSAHWRQSLLRARSEGNIVLDQIRARIRRELSSQGSSVVEQAAHTRHVVGSIPAPASISQPGTGRACVRLELERADHCGATSLPVQARSTVGSALDGNLLSESGVLADKTARTETEPRAEEISKEVRHEVTATPSAPRSHGAEAAASLSFAAAGSAAPDRSGAKRCAEAGSGDSLFSAIWGSPECREEPGRLLCGAQRSDCLADVILNGTDGRPGNSISQQSLTNHVTPQ